MFGQKEIRELLRKEQLLSNSPFLERKPSLNRAVPMVGMELKME
jgi:hypothetical protein